AVLPHVGTQLLPLVPGLRRSVCRATQAVQLLHQGLAPLLPQRRLPRLGPGPGGPRVLLMQQPPHLVQLLAQVPPVQDAHPPPADRLPQHALQAVAPSVSATSVWARPTPNVTA